MSHAVTTDNIAARTFTIERVFNAPREKVFAAFTDCKHLMHWWGPNEWPISQCDMDFRVGGSWHYAMRETATGNESWGLMLFDEINAPEFIRYRDVFSDANRTVNTELPETAATLHFYEEGGKTRVVSNSTYPDEATLKQILDMGMEQGLKETWDRLETYVSAG
ncbi:MAG: SRPBCC domain-containing protein [Chloroflexota bacterium]|nr:SRPBCC domain-containing protein [Chloroflexota bacterium]